MSWNCRVLRFRSGDGLDSEYYAIHEVFYDAQGVLQGVAEMPVCLLAGGFGDLQAFVGKIEAALGAEVLDFEQLSGSGLNPLDLD